MEEIEIIKPDDWHIHFRDNEIMSYLCKQLGILLEELLCQLVPNIKRRRRS